MNFHYNYVSLVIFLIILIGIHARKMTLGRTNQIYISMVYLSIVATLCDFLPYVFQYPLSDGELFLVNLINYGYFFSRNLCILLYILFLFSVSRTWNKIRAKRNMILMVCPYIVIVGALVWNMFQPRLFYISALTGYERRDLIFILYIMSGLYCVIALFYLFYCKRFIPTEKWLALLSLLILSAFAIVAQGMVETLHVEMFSMAISMLLMLLFVQRPEEQMDPQVQVFGFDAYRTELKKIVFTRQKVTIGVITFTNADEVRTYMGDDRYMEYIENVLRKMAGQSASIEADCGIFFEYPGRVYTIVDTWDYYGDELAQIAYDSIEDYIYRGAERGAFLTPVYSIFRFPDRLTTVDEVLNYGRNQEHFFAPGEKRYSLADRFFNRSDFEIFNHIDEILYRAIEQHLFEMYYQPIYSAKEQTFTSAEALIRLNDPEYGYISPAVLINVAEQRGLMNIIGNYVLEMVFAFVGSKEFAELGLDYIEVNLSIHQCMNPDLARTVRQLEEKYGVSPSLINFEVTETANVDFESILDRNMQKLKKMGYTFSLDDYGTGYSNIHRVSRLPLSIIKIDKQMVDDMGEEKGFIILKNSVRMMKDINMRIVVEGVEEKEYADAVIDLGCDYIQGYYYAKPMPKDELITFLN